MPLWPHFKLAITLIIVFVHFLELRRTSVASIGSEIPSARSRA